MRRAFGAGKQHGKAPGWKGTPLLEGAEDGKVCLEQRELGEARGEIQPHTKGF